MTVRRILAAVFLFFGVFGVSSQAWCQTALNAPPEDRVYQAIDIFIAHGLVNDVIVGQRPFSRLEVARILKQARAALPQKYDSDVDSSLDEFSKALSQKRYLESLLDYYDKEYAVELKGMEDGVLFDALNRLEMSYIYNTSLTRRIPVNNGEGSIDGYVTSFDRNDQGITYVDGSNFFLSTQHDLYASRYFAMTAQPRFEFVVDSKDDAHVYAHLHRLYAKAGWRNVELEVGRDNLMWGQGEFGGLLASADPRPLDMIKLSNPYPWQIKYVGGMKFTLFVANKGPDQNFRYPYFYGVKWSWRPARFFEFALSHTITMGGEGAPGVKWWEPIAELMPFHKWGGGNIGQADIANNAWGFFEFRATIPPIRNSVLYYEGYIEDSIVRAIRLPDNLLNQLAFVAGVYVPRLKREGDVALRLEYRHIPPLAYRHGTWTSGYTLNQRVIGDPLGPTADGAYATLYWRPTPARSARLDLAYEDFDSSTYYTQSNADGGGDRILKDVAGPHERRYRAVLGMDWQGKGRLGFKMYAGYERIQNWNFETGRSVNNMLLGANVKLSFDEFRFRSH